MHLQENTFNGEEDTMDRQMLTRLGTKLIYLFLNKKQLKINVYSVHVDSSLRTLF